jgi:hypothetical protein
MSVPNDSQRLTPDFPTLVAHFVPRAIVHFVASVSDLSRQRNDLAYHQLGYAAGVAEGRIEHANAMLGGIFQVDLVRANAETADDNQVAGRGQDS